MGKGKTFEPVRNGRGGLTAWKKRGFFVKIRIESRHKGALWGWKRLEATGKGPSRPTIEGSRFKRKKTGNE